jgi:GNAT superfamily N-acetyltransferase
MEKGDIEKIAEAFAAQGWNKPITQYQNYYREQQEGKRTVLVLCNGEEFTGYLNIIWESCYLPFREQKIPEINDFNVLIKYQRQGYGTQLMDAAEKIIAARSKTAGIGVGLTADYGTAQRMYVRRGYIPDGRGLSQNEKSIVHGDIVTVDDDLILTLTKELQL